MSPITNQCTCGPPRTSVYVSPSPYQCTRLRVGGDGTTKSRRDRSYRRRCRCPLPLRFRWNGVEACREERAGRSRASLPTHRTVRISVLSVLRTLLCVRGDKTSRSGVLLGADPPPTRSSVPPETKGLGGRVRRPSLPVEREFIERRQARNEGALGRNRRFRISSSYGEPSTSARATPARFASTTEMMTGRKHFPGR